MKQYLLLFFSAAFALITFSCEEDFNPKTDFKEQYVLNCYIDLDYDYYKATFIYANVTKIYDVDGLDPSKYKLNPFIPGAQIYLSYRGDTYLLKQDTNGVIAKRPPPIPFYKFYYSAKLKNIYPNYPVSISAKMPDGKVLTAKAQLLEGLQLGFSYNFFRGFTTKINRFLFGNSFTIDWGRVDGRLFFPRMQIPYQTIDGGYNWYYEDVPYTYVNKNGEWQPVYPSYTSTDSISYDFSAIDSTMSKVAHLKNFKNFLGNIIFQLGELDSPLSKYYESIHGNIDSYSISLDQFTYSNISGGLGIFGSRRIISKYWNLDTNYIILFIP